jgi:hypothetical protein
MKNRLLRIAAFFALTVPLLLYIVTLFLMLILSFPSPAHMAVLQWVATGFLWLQIIALVFVYYRWAVKSSSSETVKGLLLTLTTLAVLFLFTESCFVHYAQSSAIGARWSMILWYKKYICPVKIEYKNLKGENQTAEIRNPIPHLTNKKSIWYIGDSFTYGYGIDNTAQTFPALVQQQLKGITCVNLGVPGADTQRESEFFMAIAAAHKQPAAVVWQYFGNDIDGADDGIKLVEQELQKSSRIQFGRRFFQNKSFVLDYIYWQYFAGNETGSFNTYSNFLNHTYLTDSVVVNGQALKDSAQTYITPYSKHLTPLKQTAAYCKSKGIKFLVVIFPFLWENGPENSEQLYCHRLENKLKAENTDVINLMPLVKDIPLNKRIANSHDPHPSVLVSQITADTLAKYIAAKYKL